MQVQQEQGAMVAAGEGCASRARPQASDEVVDVHDEATDAEDCVGVVQSACHHQNIPNMLCVCISPARSSA